MKTVEKTYDRGMLAKKPYFQSVIDAMKEQGFEFLSWVTMDSVRHVYHVDWHGLSQHSMLFFFVPKKAMLVCLTYVEHLGAPEWDDEGIENWNPDTYRAYWSGWVCYAYDAKSHWETLWEQAYKAAQKASKTFVFMSDVEVDHRYGVSDVFNADGIFRPTHFGFAQHFDSVTTVKDPRQKLSAQDVTRVFGRILSDLKPFLYPRFRQLDRLLFEPHYCFPKSLDAFWARFNMKRLKQSRITKKLTR